MQELWDASRSIRLNGITVGGINYAGSYGNKRDKIFSINQLGGVGRFRSIFLAGGGLMEFLESSVKGGYSNNLIC